MENARRANFIADALSEGQKTSLLSFDVNGLDRIECLAQPGPLLFLDKYQ